MSGKYGTWFYQIPSNVGIILEGKKLTFYVNFLKNLYTDARVLNKDLNIITSVIQNLIFGIGLGFKKKLRIRGKGHKWVLTKKFIGANLGLSHIVKKELLWDFKSKTILPKKKDKEVFESSIQIKSKSCLSLTQFLSQYRKQKLPNFYTGKGIRYKIDIVPSRNKEKERRRKNKSK